MNHTHFGNILETFIREQSTFCFIYLGSLFPMDEDWNFYYQRSQYRLTQRYFSKSPSLLLEYSVAPEERYQNELLKIRQSLVLSLNSRDEKQLTAYIHEIFQSIAAIKNESYLTLVITEILIIYHVNFQIPENLPQNINDFSASLIDEEYQLSSLESVILYYGLLCIEKNETASSDIAMSKRMISFIQKNYKNPELSVSQIAEIFQLHPSYLGSVFKKATNHSILQYITDVRLEAAKKLLSSGTYKVSEVAEEVGYSDVFYFSKRFKKSFGCSPKDYSSRNTLPK